MKSRSSGRFLSGCTALLLLNGFSAGKTLGAEAAGQGSVPLKYEEPKFITGAIYSNDRKQLLFRFTRSAKRSGSTLNVQRDFSYPDAKLAARERVVYQGDALASYELEETQLGSSGSARIRRDAVNPAKGSIQFEYLREAGGRPKTRNEALRENTLIADMVGPFLVAHWDALRRGEKIECRYIVVPRRETVGFTFAKDTVARRQDQDVLIVKMGATSPIIAALVDPLFFAMEQAPPHRVLEYQGRTTPKIRSGKKWDDMDAVTVFDWHTSEPVK
jgi:hypothetical protein